MLHAIEWLAGAWLLTRIGSRSWSGLYRMLPRVLMAWTLALALPPRLERQAVVLAVFAVLVLVLSLNRTPPKKKGGTQKLEPKPGPTDLLSAVEAGDVEAVERLLKSGVDLGQRSAEGETALHLAARGGRLQIVEALLRAGADFRSRNHQEQTPLQVAQTAGHQHVVERIKTWAEERKAPPPTLPKVEVGPGVQSVAAEPVKTNTAWDKAQEEVAAGNLEAALPHLEQASVERPEDGQVWSTRALTLARLSRFQEALRSYDKAVALAPDQVANLKGKGICLMQLGQPAAALVSLERAQGLAERDPVLWLCLAEAHEELDHSDDAVRCYDKVLELESDHLSALEQKAACLADAGRLEEAVVLSKKAVERHPNDAASWYLRGILLDWMGNQDGSTHALEQAEHLGMAGDVNLLDLRRRWTNPIPRL